VDLEEKSRKDGFNCSSSEMIIVALEMKREAEWVGNYIHIVSHQSTLLVLFKARQMKLLVVNNVQVLALFTHLSLRCWWKIVET
jgi:hypothetical protein